jgi:hypothetical protein
MKPATLLFGDTSRRFLFLARYLPKSHARLSFPNVSIAKVIIVYCELGNPETMNIRNPGRSAV